MMDEREEQRRATVDLIYTALYEIHRAIHQRRGDIEAGLWLASTAVGLNVSVEFLTHKIHTIAKALETGRFNSD